MQESKKEFTVAKLASFLTLPEEQLLIARRQHWLTPTVPIIGTIFFTFFAITLCLYFFLVLFPSIFIFTVSILLIITITLHFLIKQLIDWYFHFYIVTNRKILELSYSPLSKQSINDIFLDQVRCTEIDIQTKGLINEIFDIGDVIITFDRPTHEEEFTLFQIKDPKTIGTLLGDALGTIMSTTTSFWNKQKNNSSRFQFTEEIFPNITNAL